MELSEQTDKSKYLFYCLEYIRNNFNAMLEFYMGDKSEMANFEFLKNQKEYILFANAAIEAEKVLCDFSGHVSCWGAEKRWN